jgi:hypothetical protein
MLSKTANEGVNVADVEKRQLPTANEIGPNIPKV